ncbi:MAG TPA: ABC transporter substrate-binding protein [Stellaceae bacterium]|nr:ABC transporter substrate-binding protein [Stellaceae bacterium]
MDKIAFPYRSSTHLTLLHVISESGSWEKHGLDVEYNRKISSSAAHAAVLSGDVEFVGGNHVSTYAHRARGDEWVYLGQTINTVARQLVVRADSGISGVDDLRQKVVGTRGAHPGLNDWLFLKQRGLDIDRDDVALVSQVQYEKNSLEPAKANADEETEPLWHWVRDKKVDAAFVLPPGSDFARAAGLKVIDIEPMPMIYYTTLSSGLKFVEKHPDIVERFLKGVIEGIHFFKTQPEKTIRILRNRYELEGKMDEATAARTYAHLAHQLEPRLYPTMAAIANVYEEAIRQDKDAKRINPMELWDLHFIRHLDDIGFADRLYGTKRPSR